MRRNASNFIASITALAVLLGTVTVAIAATEPGDFFWPYEIMACLFIGVIAFSVWNGDPWRRGHDSGKEPRCWQEWLLLAIGGTALSAIFVALDVYVLPTSGIGIVFTASTVAMAVVALTGALRAWLLVQLQDHDKHCDASHNDYR